MATTRFALGLTAKPRRAHRCISSSTIIRGPLRKAPIFILRGAIDLGLLARAARRDLTLMSTLPGLSNEPCCGYAFFRCGSYPAFGLACLNLWAKMGKE